jgi:hypothetical protein
VPVFAPRLLALVVLAACGTSEENASVPDATADAMSAMDAELVFADADASDAWVAPIDLGDAAGFFLCSGCICDGTKNYCDESWSPGPILVEAGAFGDAGYCADSIYYTRCKPLPAPCKTHLNCQCLMDASGGCPCEVDDSGAGLVYTCVNANHSRP